MNIFWLAQMPAAEITTGRINFRKWRYKLHDMK